MIFAQSSFVYFNYHLLDAIERLHRAGYGGIEIWGGRPHAYRSDLDDQVSRINETLDKCEMVVPNFVPAQFRYPSILCSMNESVRRDSVAYIKHAVDNAVKFRAKTVSVCPGMTLAGEDLDACRNQLKQSLVEILDHADKAGISILIEPAHEWETTLVLTVRDALDLIGEIGSERLGVLLDTGHLHVNGEDQAEAVRACRDVPLHIHIDDNNGDSDAHMVPGRGGIDFGPFAEALKEIDYRGAVSAELGFQYTLKPDGPVKETMDFLRSTFQ